MLPHVTILQDTDFVAGALLLVDKPKGWTSFDVVNKVRGLLKRKYNLKNIKVGHSGTLDPMATGLLLICTGRWTRELHGLQGFDKQYLGQITLGLSTDTYDAEGRVVSTRPVPEMAVSAFDALLAAFKGNILQHPPAYSAIKKDGKPLYALARAGKEVITTARPVVVYDIQVIGYVSPILEVAIHCGSGFYVRSLAHDLGERLGCGAHLSALTRTAIGTYRLADAFTMDDLMEGLLGA